MTSTQPYDVEIVESITGVDKREWDSLISNPASSYGWLKTLEETYIGGIQQRYLLVKKRGRLIGAAVYHVVKKNQLRGNIDSDLLGRLKKYTSRLGISFLPVLICGSAGEHFIMDKDLTYFERHTIFDLLLKTITNEASKNNLPICFRYLRDNESELMAFLKINGFNHTPVIPYLYLDIQWSCFNDYAKSLKKTSRNIKKTLYTELNRQKKQGVQIEIEKTPGQHEDRLFNLINDQFIKYNGRPFYLDKTLIHKAQKNLGSNCKFYIAWKQGKITGTSFSINANGIQNIYFSAVDRKATGNDMTYFNIAFNKPLIDAISEGIHRIDHGLGMAEMKIRRGCRAGNQYLFYQAPTNIRNRFLKPWFILLSKWYQIKSSGLRKKHPSAMT